MLYEILFGMLPPAIRAARDIPALQAIVVRFDITKDRNYVNLDPASRFKGPLRNTLNQNPSERISASDLYAELNPKVARASMGAASTLPACWNLPAPAELPPPSVVLPKSPGRPKADPKLKEERAMVSSFRPDVTATESFFTIKDVMTNILVSFLLNGDRSDVNEEGVIQETLTQHKETYQIKTPLKAGDTIISVNDQPWSKVWADEGLRNQMKKTIWGALTFRFNKAPVSKKAQAKAKGREH